MLNVSIAIYRDDYAVGLTLQRLINTLMELTPSSFIKPLWPQMKRVFKI